MIEHFRRHGFTRVAGLLDPADLHAIEGAHARLIAKAESLLAKANRSGVALAKTYERDRPELIVVPEREDPAKVCRMEYLAASDGAMRSLVQDKLLPAIAQVAGEAYRLFKDKCNEKRPGGGAFPPHQDFPAYKAFGPSYHVTAMVALDDAGQENGCLSFAANFKEVVKAHPEFAKEWFGDQPMVGYYEGGRKNGDILAEISRHFDWQLAEAKAGDVVLFDSFVPHYSPVNGGQRSRRALFFTCNRAAEGDHYESYYRKKRAEYDNPMFHIATPTAHAAMDAAP
jgi:ectoine hydroxylase-related dioxygenase (phytanoyl-CoA dioxygenase family)